jgi:pimeloyl-ACP methyl ester carboxylesterase
MASPGRGPVFVLIHSPLVGPTTWSPLVEELERRGRETVVPPLLGVAETPSPQWRHVPDAVRAVATRAGGPSVLVGHSGGGLLLPVIADARPGERDALVFMDSFLPPASGSLPLAPPELMEQLRALARLLSARRVSPSSDPGGIQIAGPATRAGFTSSAAAIPGASSGSTACDARTCL